MTRPMIPTIIPPIAIPLTRGAGCAGAGEVAGRWMIVAPPAASTSAGHAKLDHPTNDVGPPGAKYQPGRAFDALISPQMRLCCPRSIDIDIGNISLIRGTFSAAPPASTSQNSRPTQWVASLREGWARARLSRTRPALPGACNGCCGAVNNPPNGPSPAGILVGAPSRGKLGVPLGRVAEACVQGERARWTALFAPRREAVAKCFDGEDDRR